MKHSYHCPYCNRISIIESEKGLFERRNEILLNDKVGYQVITTKVEVCSNPLCEKYSLTLLLADHKQVNGKWVDLEPIKNWNLIPESKAKQFADYIPSFLISDYNEACRIASLSPKASSTLSRRCLQGMIRDFWGITKDTLFQEINALSDKIDEPTWNAIDSLRKIGNIGAHMEKDVNFIVDVEPKEAELLIELIETLFEEWYISRYERNVRMQRITTLASMKKSNS